MRFGFLFGAGAERGYGLPSGGTFALDIFRYDTTPGKNQFKDARHNVDGMSNYAHYWLPENYHTKSISVFGKSVFQSIIKDTIDNNRDYIISKLKDFDQIASRQVDKISSGLGLSVVPIIEKVIGRAIDNTHLDGEYKFVQEFSDGNAIFSSTFYSALLLVYKQNGYLNENQRKELRTILLSIMQLQVGALGEKLARKINDNLFEHKDDDNDLFDDIGEIIQLNYSATGTAGLEFLLNHEIPDTSTDGGIILKFAEMIIEDVYASIIDYKTLIDSYWHYLYSPRSDWAKFCKICVFLFTVRNYIDEQAQRVVIADYPNGYYNLLKKEIDKGTYDVSEIATTNYNHFVDEILERHITHLNGATDMWYDPYLNRVGDWNSVTTDEHHILVPLMFTQSGTKPMTSINMSELYVNAYQAWKESDAIVVVGFGFNEDDEHINGILRTLIDVDKRKLIVVSTESLTQLQIGNKLKVSAYDHIYPLCVDPDGYTKNTHILWTEAITNVIV